MKPIYIILFVLITGAVFSKDNHSQEVPSAQDMLELIGKTPDNKYVYDFIKSWDLKVVRKIRTEDCIHEYELRNARGILINTESVRTNVSTTTIYSKRLVNGFTVSITFIESYGFPQCVDSVTVYFKGGIALNPHDMELKAQMLPYGLRANDTPQTVKERYGREERESLIEDGRGFLDYTGAIDKGFSFKVNFHKGVISSCEMKPGVVK